MRRRHYSRCEGLTLVEIMVALTISSALFFAFSSFFVTSRQTQDAREYASRLSEASRVFTEFFARDIRMAGYANDLCIISGPGLNWDDDSKSLTIRTCEHGKSDPISRVYQFNAAQSVLLYDSGGGALDTLLTGVDFHNIWFGKLASDNTLKYTSGDSAGFGSIVSVRVNFTFLGNLEKNQTQEGRATPSFEFTVAVRNNLYTANAGGGQE